jgi:xylose dehydrogenase (NAD/NADP)
MTLRWGIVGLGHWATEAIAPAITRAADTRLVAVFRRNVGLIKEFSEKYEGVRIYDSLDKMLQDREIDVVYICTPHGLHHLHTIQAAEAGKHVMCEKPMALTVADAELMIASCKKTK